ncbi:hypothetical protein TWF694_000628 [Orbilia ellipsospora]|uniref:Secreted protein n=1 Tax=Orbilia ellipsospora TaxID=2528407 RepID=A0AAV9XP59_9PEZI
MSSNLLFRQGMITLICGIGVSEWGASACHPHQNFSPPVKERCTRLSRFGHFEFPLVTAHAMNIKRLPD